MARHSGTGEAVPEVGALCEGLTERGQLVAGFFNTFTVGGLARLTTGVSWLVHRDGLVIVESRPGALCSGKNVFTGEGIVGHFVRWDSSNTALGFVPGLPLVVTAVIELEAGFQVHVARDSLEWHDEAVPVPFDQVNAALPPSGSICSGIMVGWEGRGETGRVTGKICYTPNPTIRASPTSAFYVIPETIRREETPAQGEWWVVQLSPDAMGIAELVSPCPTRGWGVRYRGRGPTDVVFVPDSWVIRRATAAELNATLGCEADADGLAEPTPGEWWWLGFEPVLVAKDEGNGRYQVQHGGGQGTTGVGRKFLKRRLTSEERRLTQRYLAPTRSESRSEPSGRYCIDPPYPGIEPAQAPALSYLAWTREETARPRTDADREALRMHEEFIARELELQAEAAERKQARIDAYEEIRKADEARSKGERPK
jgi:hypothetical protein